MRYYSIIIFLINTLVLNFSLGSPNVALPKKNSNPEAESSLDNIADPVQLDSMHIQTPAPESEAIKYEKSNNLNFYNKYNKKKNILAAIGFYDGPSAKTDSINSLTYGLQLNYFLSETESLRCGFSIVPNNQEILTVANQYLLIPKIWGRPYWNLHGSLLIDSANGLASFTNLNNFLFGATFGAMLNNNWGTELSADPINLRGISLNAQLYYLFYF